RGRSWCCARCADGAAAQRAEEAARMETVIRASRLALGRTVLATHAVAGQAPVAPTVRSVDAGQPATSSPDEQRPSAADAGALRRAPEDEVREELDEQVRRKLDEQ